MCYCTPSIRTPFCRNCTDYMHTEIESLRAELEAEKQERDELVEFVNDVRRTGDTRLASMAIAILAKVGADKTARPPTPTGWSDTDWIKHLQEQHPMSGLHINKGSMDAAADAYEAEYNAAKEKQ